MTLATFSLLARWISANTPPGSEARLACYGLVAILGQEANKLRGNKKDFDEQTFKDLVESEDRREKDIEG